MLGDNPEVHNGAPTDGTSIGFLCRQSEHVVDIAGLAVLDFGPQRSAVLMSLESHEGSLECSVALAVGNDEGDVLQLQADARIIPARTKPSGQTRFRWGAIGNARQTGEEWPCSTSDRFLQLPADIAAGYRAPGRIRPPAATTQVRAGGRTLMEGFVPIIETHATVTVYFPKDDPRDFDDLMGVAEGEPDLARGSERRPPGRPHWSLRSQGRVDGETDDHVRWLLDRLEPSREHLLRAIKRGAEARLWIYWLADNVGPHVWISEDVVRRTAGLNLSLHVDAYREDV